MRSLILASSMLLLAACAAPRTTDGPEPDRSYATIAEALEGRAWLDGFVGLSHAADEGQLWVRLPPAGEPFLHAVALVAGLGSNDVGLDRGQLSTRSLLVTRRVGGVLQLVAPNLDFRVGSDDPAIRAAAAEAFAESVVAALPIVAEDADGTLLVDASEFVLQDAHDVAGSLRRTGQGSFSLAPDRSQVIADGLRTFPDNAHVDVRQTFAGQAPGPEVRSTTPVPSAVTLTVRHHFARLPAEPMAPRRADPRSGYFTTSWRQLDVAPDAPTRVDVIARHRLPADGSPIVYHLDRGAPEPMRTALLEGARYWEQAFADAGLPGRFRVELLPEGADIHDLRYNTIQWVFRSTRGWSYGNSIVDPRSGEILKGHVTLGALRVRQDVRLIEGLLAPYAENDSDPRVIETALARLRQLAAHEVGHTLGLRHHFAASTSGRASVMDYPPPRVELGPDGVPTVEAAYRPSAGEWDALAIRYGYGTFEPRAGETAAEAEERGLEEVLAEVQTSGLALLSDADASAGIHPDAHRWDDGSDAGRALRTALDVRRAALARFDEAALTRGRPLSDLELTLAPLYFHHRYQADAAAALVGGREFRHEVRGAAEPLGIRPLVAEQQRSALDALLEALAPETLALPDGVRRLLAPPAPGSPRDRERFDPTAGLFDPLHAARAATALVLDRLLDPERLDRVAVQAADDPDQLSLEELFGRLIDWGWSGDSVEGHAALLLREARGVLLDRQLELLADPNLSSAIAEALHRTYQFRRQDGRWLARVPLAQAERMQLERYFNDPLAGRRPASAPRVPPGPPIGCGGDHFHDSLR